MTAVAGYPNYGYANDNEDEKCTKKSPSYSSSPSSQEYKPECIHIISDCTGNNLRTLATKVQSFYEPIIVPDNIRDDDVKNDVKNCLNPEVGGGRAIKSDSDAHIVISGCINKDPSHLSDSSEHTGRTDSDKNPNNKNFHKKLKDSINSNNGFIIASDSSLLFKDPNNNYPVLEAFKAYTKKNDDELDYRKIGNKKGDLGHKYYILKDDSGSKARMLKNSISTYKNTSVSTKDIILTSSAYIDTSVFAAIAACKSAGATETEIPYVDPNITITMLNITQATIINPVINNTNQYITKITDGAILSGSATTTSGTSINVTGANISSGTITPYIDNESKSIITGVTILKATISVPNPDSSSRNNSGRLSFREITSSQ